MKQQAWFKSGFMTDFVLVSELPYPVKLGYNKLGYNKLGYNKLGYNKLGYNKLGYNDLGYRKLGYNEHRRLILSLT
jgi:hypothetical protein